MLKLLYVSVAVFTFLNLCWDVEWRWDKLHPGNLYFALFHHWTGDSCRPVTVFTLFCSPWWRAGVTENSWFAVEMSSFRCVRLKMRLLRLSPNCFPSAQTDQQLYTINTNKKNKNVISYSKGCKLDVIGFGTLISYTNSYQHRRLTWFTICTLALKQQNANKNLFQKMNLS